MKPRLKKQIRYVIEKYSQPALVEEFVDGRELNVSVIEINGKMDVLPISEIDYSEFPEGIPRICGYEAKWIPESLEYQKSKPVCPAPLDAGHEKEAGRDRHPGLQAVRMPGLCKG